MRVEIRNEEPAFPQLDNNVGISDSDLVSHFKHALTSVSTGDSDEYNHLVAVMHHRGPLAADEVAMLVTSLKGLSEAVSYIDNVLHHSLLASIFSMNLWNCRTDVMDALLELIISLAASSGKYVDSCLEMLVGHFMPPQSFTNMLKEPRGISRKDQVLSRVHSSLKIIADLVPLSPMRLVPIVIQRKPHYCSKETSLVVYGENMLKLESGVFGELVRSTMLSGFVDLLIDLDVEIGWDDILQDDSSKGIFNMELEDLDEATDDELMDGNELPRELSRKGLVGNLFAEKLDSLMVLLFEHLYSCEAVGRLSEVFEILLQSFQKTVLTAYKSKFSQFVMFYACALDPENCGSRFAKMLADIFVCNAYPPLLRMSAVAYLASYLSRGKFLSTSLIANTLKRLVEWCLDYCKMQEGEVNPQAHRIFYSGCQAIMYVLCFRMRSMMGVPWFKSQLLAPINLILSHNLGPLKVCLPSIVTEFLRQSKAADLFTASERFDFDDYLESEFSRAFGGMERLDMFFPFDPCLLKKSDSYIRPNYVYWSMVRPTYDDEEDSSDEEVDVNAEIERNDEFSRNHEDFDLDEFDNALNQMSITPKYRFGGALNDPLRMPSRIRPSTSPESL
ncbi:RNA polymerase I specific transcription initiation factor [Trema orientale]|uniref:RNA polymerase I specific transcription initiation factor n=1 Tax=Trema orientale TaxID=63057 RepID=A0A2P5DZI3_TREOI|nr:RNA polymerase I specific transcription initiation factor [Trema orientale]